MKLLAELKRRNVFRVSIAYVVLSWLILQMGDLLFDLMGLPDWANRIVLVILLLGFPVAVIFSWIYELTPEGIKKESAIDRTQSITPETGRRLNYITIGMIVVGIAVVGIDRFFVPEQPAAQPATDRPAASSTTPGDPGDETSPAPAATADETPSIAVLPFADMSPDGDQAYFSDGLAEEILNVLVRIEDLKVASRTTSWGFKGQEALGIPLIAEKMKVRHVLEGSVRKSGDRVRITAQLIDANTDQHLWSETYDRTLTAESVFEVQDDIAKSIVEQLGIIMDADTVVANHATDTSNIDAYDLYLEAWQLFVDRRSLPRAIDLFEQSVATDPGFARAWSGLAAIYNVAPGWGIIDRDYNALAREAAETAIKLNPELSLPYAVLALKLTTDLPVDYEQSLALFDEALARNPKNTTAYLWRTIVYLDLGHFDRAERDALQCLDIDPAYEICRSFLAMAVLFAGDTERALDIHETALRHGFNGNNLPFLYVYANTGREFTALVSVAANNAARGINKATTYEYRALTDPAFDYEAEKMLIDQAYFPAGASEPEWSPAHPDFLFVYRQYDQIEINDLAYWWFPYPLEFRDSPERKRLMRDIGLPAYWREQGFPPQCRAKGADDFECD